MGGLPNKNYLPTLSVSLFRLKQTVHQHFHKTAGEECLREGKNPVGNRQKSFE